MEKTIYIRMRHRIQVKPNQPVFLKDVVQVIAEEGLLKKLDDLLVHQVTKKDKNYIVINVMQIISQSSELDSDIEVQTIGPSQTIIEVVQKKKYLAIPFFILVWLLLFFGSALAIMNFHDDVSMQSVHQRLYKIFSGKEINKPLIFQIPYSLGLGLGMILFFNHLFKKRFNEEPSPLEVEIFKYQQDLDNYVVLHENKDGWKKLNDD